MDVVDEPASVTDNQSATFAAVEITGFRRAIRFAHSSNQPPIQWFKQSKCADGALIIKSGRQIVAHVFEHKSSINPKEWFKAKQQVDGMCSNIKAALAVVGSEQPSAFVVHVSFTEDRMNLVANPADMVFLKALTGSSKPLLDVSDWEANRAEVPGVGVVEVRKIPRDPQTGIGQCSLN